MCQCFQKKKEIVFLRSHFIIFQADIWEPMPYLIYGVCGTIAGGLTLLLPETLDQKLPQTIDDAIALRK